LIKQKLHLVQNWICKNEVIDAKSTKITKITMQRELPSNPFQQILLQK